MSGGGAAVGGWQVVSGGGWWCRRERGRGRDLAERVNTIFVICVVYILILHI
ncbi:hypothetical protein HanIR_Chr08g0355601 [Helianthus annuus]|nr:hypothetical protein HanIR_Chr08g0355601 [Helianthus annuus]